MIVIVVALLLALGSSAAGADPLLCDACRRTIEGQYVVYEGRNLHDDCYLRYYARYCGICGGPISGQYLSNSWGDVICAVHVGEHPLCEFCGRLAAEPLTGRGVRYPDGRQICGVCYASAVAETGEARVLLDTVTTALRSHGIEVGQDFALNLVDKLEMAGMTPATGRESWGFTALRQRGGLFGLLESRTVRVYALTGMPRDVLAGVLAHELMHVWLFEHAPLEMDDVLIEGSCEYAAYLVLKERPGQLAHHCLALQSENESLLYGGGFRSVSAYVRQAGVAGWLDYLRANEEPPWD